MGRKVKENRIFLILAFWFRRTSHRLFRRAFRTNARLSKHAPIGLDAAQMKEAFGLPLKI